LRHLFSCVPPLSEISRAGPRSFGSSHLGFHAAAYRPKLAAGLALVLVLLAAAPRSSRAEAVPQDQAGKPLKQLTLEQLGNVEVTTASKEPETVWNTAAAIYVITQEDIQRSGATSIPDALRLAPGVEVARISGDEWSIGIRGFGSRLSRSVLVLIDGRSVYSTFTAGVYWEVQDTLMEDIDRIEVIRGPGGTIWGPNAVNGVINIITKNSKDTQGGLLAAGGGNVEQGFAEARYGAGKGKDLTYRVYGKGFARSSQFHPDGFNYDPWQGGQAGFRMDWSKTTRDTFTLQGDIYDDAAGEAVQASTYNPPSEKTLEGYAHLSGGNILWSWKRTLAEKKDIQLTAYYDRTNRHEVNFGDVRNTVSVDFLERFTLPRQEISWGLGLWFSHGDEIEVVSGLRFAPPEVTDQLYTAFLQDEITLLPNRLSLVAGTKLLKTNFTGALFEPSVRLLYTPTPTQTVWAAFTHAVRTPAEVERDFFLSSFIGTASNGLPFFARFNANRNFRSEELNGYELGYRHLVGSKVYLDIAGFFNQYHDLLSEDLTGPIFVETDPAPTHVLLPAEFGNGLKATTEGGEVASEWRPRSYWRLRGSYSFLEMHVEKGRGSGDIGTAPIIQGSSPQHQLLFQSNFDLPKSLTADFQVRYVSDLPALQVPAYWTGDASLGWDPTKQVHLSVVGQNLFQPYHYESPYDPRGLVGIKRSVYGKIAWRWK
jgi:iron complex outermembrane recepter protein